MTDNTQSRTVKENVKNRSTWMRGLYMLLFLVIYGIAEFLVIAVTIFQFLSTVFTRKTNERLLAFGSDLSSFIYKIMLFLTYNSDDKPFPFDRWPAETGAVTIVDEPR